MGWVWDGVGIGLGMGKRLNEQFIDIDATKKDRRHKAAQTPIKNVVL